MIIAFAIAKAFSLPPFIFQGLAVKSITVPIAVEITEIYGGNSNISAAFVILTGVMGTMIAPKMMDKLKHYDALRTWYRLWYDRSWSWNGSSCPGK
ncbi:LrgB family protein [Peribacillus frigoritolerans]|nr:LrgB family protein [Peribacillus frigoritolerans]